MRPLEGSRRTRPRGYLLLVALVLLFILMLLAMALIHQERSAVLAFLQVQARSEEMESVDSAVGQLGAALGGQLPPGWVGMPPPGEVTLESPTSPVHVRFTLTEAGGRASLFSRPPTDWSRNIARDEESVPAVGYREGLLRTAGGDVRVPPWDCAVLMDSSTRGRYAAVYNPNFAYGAYAPKGSIRVGSVRAGANPNLEEGAKSLDPNRMLSGLPVLLRARGHLEVGDLPAGYAESEEGPVVVRGGAPGYTGPLPPDRYAAAISAQIEDAANSLASATLERSSFVVGQALRASAVVSLFKGDWGALNVFGLRQALRFPFPAIPAVADNLPLFWAFLFYVPYPPDTSSAPSGIDKLVDRVREDVRKIEEKQEEVDSLEAEVEKLEAWLARRPDDRDADEWKARIGEHRRRIVDLEEEIRGLKEGLERLAREIKRKQEEQRFIVGGRPPESQEEEGKFRTFGWAYAGLFSRIVGFVGQLIRGRPEAAMNNLANPIRMVHFGPGAPDIQYPSDHAFDWACTWVVPPGRTLRLTADVTVRGDVWVQRGATLHIAAGESCRGNLTVTRAPSGWADVEEARGQEGGRKTPLDPLLVPQGRIFLEEGATLLVDGDLSVGGTRELGSILVSSRIGDVHPIASAILVRGDARIPHGVLPGVLLDDVALYVGKKNVYDRFLRPLFRTVAPAAGKIVGPFWYRKCWFADYATTFEMFPVLEIIGLGAVPLPIPLPYENCARKVFTPLSVVFMVELNANLGEFLYTNTFWWPFGNGVVPMVPKVAPEVFKESWRDFQPRDLRSLNWGDRLKSFAADVVKDLAKAVVTSVIRQIVVNLIKSVIPFKPPVCFGGDGSKDEKASVLTRASKEVLKEALGEVKGALKAFVGKILKDMMPRLKGLGQASLYEQPAVLVYARGNLVVGDPHERPEACCPVTSGWYVAGKNLYMHAQTCVGALLSVTGDIDAHALLYYPYFTRASLYVPKKFGSIFEQLVQFDIPESRTAPAFIGRNAWYVTARGWKR